MSFIKEFHRIEDYFVGSTNVIKNIVNEIVHLCLKQGDILIEENVVALTINLLCLNPTYDINLYTISLDRAVLERFINICVLKFLDHTSPTIRTIKCQVYFMEHSINKQRIVECHKKILQLKIYSLLREITESEITTIEERNLLFKKIIIDIIVSNSLGNASNPKVLQETTFALKSVMSKNDLINFIKLKKTERLQTLNEIRQIVCGIRVFNKDAGYCSEGIINLEQFVQNGYHTTKSQLTISLNEIVNRINLLSTALTKCYHIENDYKMKIKLPIEMESNNEDADAEDDSNINSIFELLKNILIIYRQIEYYIQKLLLNLIDLKLNADYNLKIFRNQLNIIHEIVKYRTAIPTDKIFPKFIELSNFWLGLQDHVYVLSEVNQVNEYLMQQIEDIYDWEPLAYTIIDDYTIETDYDRVQKVENTHKIVAEYENFDIVEFTDTLKIENLGFCTWAIIEGSGLIIPSNYSLGICKYKNRNYAFSCIGAAKYFMANPENALFKIIQLSRNQPELIILLNTFDDVIKFRNDLGLDNNAGQDIFSDGKKVKPSVSVNSIEVQTEIHPIPQKYDKDYMWNVWDYRRRAIQLANLRKCKTTSAQTNLSYQKADANTQMWSGATKPHKSQETQTTLDECTNVPKPQIYNRYFNRGIYSNGMNDRNAVDDFTLVNSQQQYNLTFPIDG